MKRKELGYMEFFDWYAKILKITSWPPTTPEERMVHYNAALRHWQTGHVYI